MTEQQHPITRPFFAKCATASVRYRGTDFQNPLVNLSLCIRIAKGRLSHYPDSKGKPTIEFVGCNCHWIYGTEADRDEDLNRLVSLLVDDFKQSI